MNRATLVRLAGLAAGVAIVASCDTTAPAGSGINVSSNGNTGSSTSGSNTSGNGPTIAIDSPIVGTLINVGDSVYVRVHLHSDKGLKSATMQGLTAKGSVDLGTFSLTPRYGLLSVPNGGAFRTGLKDTTVRRYLKQTNPADTTVDSLVVVVGRHRRRRRGRHGHALGVHRGRPQGDDRRAEQRRQRPGRRRHQRFRPRAERQRRRTHRHSRPGRSELADEARHDDLSGLLQRSARRDVLDDGAHSDQRSDPRQDHGFRDLARWRTDSRAAGRRSSRSFARRARAQPRVTQVVLAEDRVHRFGDRQRHGRRITTARRHRPRLDGNIVVQTDSLPLSPPFNANAKANVALNLPRTLQGQRLGITAFAVDQSGRVGYAVPVTPRARPRVTSRPRWWTRRCSSTAARTRSRSRAPSATSRSTRRAATSSCRTRTSTSSTSGRARRPARASRHRPIAVGSLPWGMVMSNNPDTLLVANSGGTNISRVYIGSTTPCAHARGSARIASSRATPTSSRHVTRDRDHRARSGSTAHGPISYSDRPQYIAQAKGGRIFYSTRPTDDGAGGHASLARSVAAGSGSAPDLAVRHHPEHDRQRRTRCSTSTRSASCRRCRTTRRRTRCSIWDHPYGQATGTDRRLGPGSRSNVVAAARRRRQRRGAGSRASTSTSLALAGHDLRRRIGQSAVDRVR